MNFELRALERVPGAGVRRLHDVPARTGGFRTGEGSGSAAVHTEIRATGRFAGSWTKHADDIAAFFPAVSPSRQEETRSAIRYSDSIVRELSIPTHMKPWTCSLLIAGSTGRLLWFLNEVEETEKSVCLFIYESLATRIPAIDLCDM